VDEQQGRALPLHTAAHEIRFLPGTRLSLSMKSVACVGLFREPQPSRAESTRAVSPIRPVPTDNNHDDGWPESHEGQQAKAYWVRIGIAGKQYHRQQGRNADSEQGQPGPEQSAYSHSLGRSSSDSDRANTATMSAPTMEHDLKLKEADTLARRPESGLRSTNFITVTRPHHCGVCQSIGENRSCRRSISTRSLSA